MEGGPDIYVDSPNVKYSSTFIEANYEYSTTVVEKTEQRLVVRPIKTQLNIRTDRHVGRVGVMLVGWGGNNGSTLTAALVAHKHQVTWHSKRGLHTPNWYGSLTQCATLRLGMDSTTGSNVYAPLSALLPMITPNDIVVVDGWDISSVNLASAMERAAVLHYNLQNKLKPFMENMRPRPSVYCPDFIAANQADRVDNLLEGTKWEQLEAIRRDIRDVKETNKLDKVIVMWTANTERFALVIEGINDTADNLLQAIKNDHEEISPSTLFAVAAIFEGCTYINGSPQNTFVPGCIELADQEGVFIGGDDFKSGQTKLKSVLVDFLVSAGIKPVSIVSYNHLGNNDGKNLSAPKQFKSKEISKSCVVDDMVASNNIIYKPGEKIDHVVVIKYAPYVGDSKRAMDEYVSEIMLGGHNTIAIHNTCEDSLLATPIMLDLVVLAELASRIQFKVIRTGDSSVNEGDTVFVEEKISGEGEGGNDYSKFNSVLSILSYMCKAPLVPQGAPVVNALMQQRACIENILRACIGLPPENSMSLEHKLPRELFGHLFSPKLDVPNYTQS